MKQFPVQHTSEDERTYAHVLLPVKFRGTVTYQVPGIYVVQTEQETSKLQEIAPEQDSLLVHPGSRVKVDFAGKVYSAVILKMLSGSELRQEEVDRAAGKEENLPKSINYKPILEVEALPRITREELLFWEQLADYYLCSVGEVFKAAYPGSTRLQEGVKSRKTPEQFFEALAPVAEIPVPTLSEAQLQAFQSVLRTIQVVFTQSSAPNTPNVPAAPPLSKPVLLKGVTGSGKTEIYIHLAKEALSRGKSVLYLVPEIALSKQLHIRLKEVFGERLLIFHSKQTAAEKGRIQKILTFPHPDTNRQGAIAPGNPSGTSSGTQFDNPSGTQSGNPSGTSTAGTDGAVQDRAVVILGTRSALLLPHKNLGLILIDEEHDSSYKQSEPAPRYHARDAAIMLANLHRAAVVMGTATPSFESEYNAGIDRFRKVELEEKYHGAQEPQVEVIDTIAARKTRQMSGSFSQKLINEIRKTLAEGGQALIFRNRRSYSPVVECTECGHIPKCPHCNVYLSYHKYNHSLRCHYCNHTSAFSGICPNCGLDTVRYKGVGTEKLEEELKKIFPDAIIARYDADVTKSKQQEEQTLRDFTSGKIRILVGTQMISKGFDFSRLNLVAVIQAETILGIQDFRADEKALQLLSQLMGRTGRREVRGKIFIQSTLKEHPVFTRLKQLAETPCRPGQETATTTSSRQSNTVPPLLSSLLDERREFHFAPYVRMIKIILKHRNPDKLEALCQAVSNAKIPCLELTGPFVPAIDKIRGEYVKCFYVKYTRDAKLSANKEALLKAIGQIPGHQAIILDVDPL